MREIKTGFIGINQRAFLLHMRTQHFAKRLVHEVGHRVMAHHAITSDHIHIGRHRVADRKLAGHQAAVMAKHIGLNFQGVINIKQGETGAPIIFGELASVAHLPARFSIERRFIEHHNTALACS